MLLFYFRWQCTHGHTRAGILGFTLGEQLITKNKIENTRIDTIRNLQLQWPCGEGCLFVWTIWYILMYDIMNKKDPFSTGGWRTMLLLKKLNTGLEVLIKFSCSFTQIINQKHIGLKWFLLVALSEKTNHLQNSKVILLWAWVKHNSLGVNQFSMANSSTIKPSHKKT